MPTGDRRTTADPTASNSGPYTWEPYAYSTVGQHQWTLEHVIAGHGPLGKLYPLRLFHQGGLGFQEGGGTIPWAGLMHPGLSDINEPSWGGWSGRYTAEKVQDPWSRHADIRPDEENIRRIRRLYRRGGYLDRSQDG